MTTGSLLTKISVLAVSVLLSVSVNAIDWETANVPDGAKKYGPDLVKVIEEHWPEQRYQTSVYASQVHVESCITFSHKRCWNPYSQLKTSREYGFGFGQFTITKRFNKFEEIKRDFADLKSWKWEDRFDASKQLTAFVLINKKNWSRVGRLNPYDETEQTAFMLVTYNSGFPLLDMKLCDSYKDCDSSKWFGNVEIRSHKSKTKLKEYGGRSFFEISRNYPRSIMFSKRPMYKFLDKNRSN